MAAEPTDPNTDVAQASDMLKKPEFIDRVIARVDAKKRDAKPVIEAALAVLADALASGEDVNLPPAGKFRVIRSKVLDEGAQVITMKLRTPKNASKAAQTDTTSADDD